MNNTNKKGFSLTEVIIATSIITIAVFGVYKLIGENTKIINNSGEYFQVNSLFPVFEECLNNIPTSIYSSNLYNFSFGNDMKGCYVGGTNTGVLIDDINYQLTGEITESGSNFIDWDLKISSDGTKEIIKSYRQLK